MYDYLICCRLLRISKVPMDANHVLETKRTLRQKRREMTVDATISADLLEELSTALQSVKSEKAAGFDGILPGIHKKRRDEDQRMDFIISPMMC
jgi:hypothetical protein